MVAPRHGALSADPQDWAGRLKPSFIIISDSKTHPEDEEFYKSANPSSRVFSTAQDGSLELEINSDGKKRFQTFSKGLWQIF
jgi:beta-lactamase superfamily II metal-dependent hydrolase